VIWPPFESKTARSRQSSSGNPEAPLHPARGVDVALVGVLPPLQGHLPGPRPYERDARLLAQARPEEVEVVSCRAVADDDLVRPVLQRLHVLAGLRHLDGEARPARADELRHGRLPETDEPEGSEGGGDGHGGDAAFHAAPFVN